MLPAQAARFPWIFSAIMPSCVVGTPPLLSSRSVTASSSRPWACSCAKPVSSTWLSRSCRAMRVLSQVVVQGSLGPRTSSCTVGVVISTVLWTSSGSLRPEEASVMLLLLWPLLSKRSGTNTRFDFLPFGFSKCGSFGSAAQELHVRLCWRYRIHARIAELEATVVSLLQSCAWWLTSLLIAA